MLSIGMARFVLAPDRASMGVYLSMRLEYGPYDIPRRSRRVFEIFIPTMNSVSVYSRDRLPHGCQFHLNPNSEIKTRIIIEDRYRSTDGLLAISVGVSKVWFRKWSECEDSGLWGIHKYSVRRLLLKVKGVKTQWTLGIPHAHSDNLILCCHRNYHQYYSILRVLSVGQHGLNSEGTAFLPPRRTIYLTTTL
ncbi:hypothetical protein BDV24DRAFT_138050 [Aspergillus arachidicola]|uniref:Uncharacterized protein n=1 Tax=Aspergillus arachidicola TaxID=656916 RepID=A0A5N6Y0U8_9EURO|nr:hypothetical protein BDV24DRAFT_138050 [Aspergillus arachidicola]